MPSPACTAPHGPTACTSVSSSSKPYCAQVDQRRRAARTAAARSTRSARRRGTPEPALIAFCSLVYWSLPVPALTSFDVDVRVLRPRTRRPAPRRRGPGPVGDGAALLERGVEVVGGRRLRRCRRRRPSPRRRQPASAAARRAARARRGGGGSMVMGVPFTSSWSDQDIERAAGVDVHCLTLPAARPDCQNRCSTRNATTIGTIVSSEPVITRLKIGCAAAPRRLRVPLVEADGQRVPVRVAAA